MNEEVRFGRLTVGSYKGSPDFHTCKCDCGHTVVRKLSSLKFEVKQGFQPDCGCMSLNKRNVASSLIGKKFGMLTALKFKASPDYFVFECDCGKAITTKYSRLVSMLKKDKTPNCGCEGKVRVRKKRIVLHVGDEVPESPCERLTGCPNFKRCKTELLACEDFYNYVIGTDFGYGGNPSEAIFNLIFKGFKRPIDSLAEA